MKKLIEDAKKLLSEMNSNGIFESTHIVHIKYDDPSGKGTASIRVPVSAKSPEHAKKRAMDKISRFPHPILGYKNAAVHRVETKKAVKEEVISEAKEETHFIGGRDVGGITTMKKETRHPDDKAFDVHYKGEHIGHIETHHTSSVQKKNSVRRVDTGKMRVKWAYQHKDPGSRTHFNYNSKRDATAELVGAHLRSKGEY